MTIDANLFKYTCLDCNFATTEKAKLNDHVVKHHDCTGIRNLNFKCITCNCEFDGEELYQSHVKTHDVVTVEQPQVQDCTAENHTILKCKECSYVSENNSELNKHEATTHGQLSDVLKEKQSEAKRGPLTPDVECTSCTQCEFDGNTKEELDAHLTSNHNGAREEVPITGNCVLTEFF